MSKRKRSMLVAMCGLLFGALILVGCIPCCYDSGGNCPSECSSCDWCLPATPAAQYWASQIEAGNNAEVIQETTEVIQVGEDAPEYAQALLYRGIAEFNLGDLESARNDLASAQVLSDRMSEDEQLRLFRTHMVVLAKLGDKTGAEQAFQNALALAPADQQDAIRMEYENALNP